MANEREYVFRLRAEDYTAKPIGDALAAVQKLVSTVNEQVEASKRGATSNAEFKDSITKLQTAVGDLVKQRIALAEAQRKEAELEEKTRQVLERRMELQKALANLQEGTSQKGVQADAINAIGNAIKSAEKQAETARLAFEKANQAVKFLGLSTDDYAAAQARVVTQLKETNAVLDAAGNASLDFGANRKKAADEAAALAKSERDRETARKAREAAEDQARRDQARQEQELGASLLAAQKKRDDEAQAQANAAAEKARKAAQENARLLSGIVGGHDSGVEEAQKAQRAREYEDALAIDRARNEERAREIAEAEAIDKQRNDERAREYEDAIALDKQITASKKAALAQREAAEAEAEAARKAREAREDAARKDQARQERELGALLAGESKKRTDAAAGETRATEKKVKASEDANSRLLSSIVAGQDAEIEARERGQRAIEVADAEALDKQIKAQKAKDELQARFTLRQQEATARALVAAQQVQTANENAGKVGSGGASGAVSGALDSRFNSGATTEALETKLRGATLSAKQYAEALVAIQAVERRLTQDSLLIDNLTGKQQKLEEAREEYARYATELERLIGVEKRTAQAENDLSRAQSQVEGSAARIQKLTEDYNRLLLQTRARGIDETKLSAEYAKQVALAQRIKAVQDGTKQNKGLFGLDPFQLQNLSFQINDVITQLSLGQGVLRTAESQGGQILQIFGARIAALGAYIPVIAAVVGAVVIGISAIGRVKEQEAALRSFEARLAALSDGSRTTARELLSATNQISRLGIAFTDAKTAVDLFTAEGIRPEKFVAFAKVARDITDVFGGEFKDRVKEVTSALGGNFEAIDKLNDSLHFLSPSAREAIQNAFEQGNAAKGQALATQALIDKQTTAANLSRSSWTVAVRELSAAYTEFLDALNGSVVERGLNNALVNTLNQLKEIAQLATSVTLLIKGEISPTRFAEIFKDLIAGKGGGLDKTKEEVRFAEDALKDLLEKAEQLRGRIKQLRDTGYSAADVSKAESNLTELEGRIEKARATLVGLRAQLSPEGESLTSLRARLSELERKRDLETAGGKTAAGAVPELVEAPTETKTKAGYDQLVRYVAQKLGIDPELALRLQKVENGALDAQGNPLRDANGNFPEGKTRDGRDQAQGGFQVKPSTFEELKRNNPGLIRGGNNDDESNATAGLLYLKQFLDKGLTPAQAVGRYAAGPTRALDAEATNEVRNVTAGYTGTGLTSTASQIDALRAQIDRLAKSSGAAAPAVGNVAAESDAAQTQAQKLRKRLDDEAEKARDNTLRGRAALARDNKYVDETLRGKLVSEAGPAFGTDTPEGKKVGAAIEETLRIERVARAKKREDEQKADDAELAAQVAKARAAFEAQKGVEREFAVYKNQLRAQANNDDKTDAERRRAAVQESFDLQIEKLKKDAKDKGVISVGNKTLDQFIAELTRAKDEVLAQVTAEAAVASVNKLVEERAAALARIQVEFKNGLITLNDQYDRSLETTRKFAPRIAAAQANALKELRAQPQTPAVVTAIEKVNDVKTSATTVEEARQNVKNGTDILDRIKAARTSYESLIKTQVDIGELTASEGLDKVRKYYKDGEEEATKAADNIQKILDKIKADGTLLPAEEFNVAQEKVKRFRAEIGYVDPEVKKLRKAIEDSFTNRIVEAFDTVAQSVGNFIAGTASIKDVFASVGTAFATMTAGILKDIATLILRTLILKAVQAGLNAVAPGAGAFLGLATSAAGGAGSGGGGGVPAAHDGWMVGHPGGQMKVVDLSVFRNAQRMHSGGMVGLASDEVPTILQRGEQVLSKSQVRAQANAAGGANASGTTGIRNVLAVGDKEIAAAMTGQHGERVVLNILRRNASTVRKMI